MKKIKKDELKLIKSIQILLAKDEQDLKDNFAVASKIAKTININQPNYNLNNLKIDNFLKLKLKTTKDFLVLIARKSIDNSKSLKTQADFQKRFAWLFFAKKTEHLLCVFLDSKLRVLGKKMFTDKSTNNLKIPLKEIVLFANRFKSNQVVLMHNHPSQDPEPSETDIKTTEVCQEILRHLDIKLLDHLVFTNTEYRSIFSYFWQYFLNWNCSFSIAKPRLKC